MGPVSGGCSKLQFLLLSNKLNLLNSSLNANASREKKVSPSLIRTMLVVFHFVIVGASHTDGYRMRGYLTCLAVSDELVTDDHVQQLMEEAADHCHCQCNY